MEGTLRRSLSDNTLNKYENQEDTQTSLVDNDKLDLKRSLTFFDQIYEEIDKTSLRENIKKRLYKQALNINQISLLTPKSQRIQSTVTKVFGLNDPPPGFGLVYPRYYYLEQKKPQPMSPLKVWRGFNGNIYFQPIQLSQQQQINPTLSLQNEAPNSTEKLNESSSKISKQISYKVNPPPIFLTNSSVLEDYSENSSKNHQQPLPQQKKTDSPPPYLPSQINSVCNSANSLGIRTNHNSQHNPTVIEVTIVNNANNIFLDYEDNMSHSTIKTTIRNNVNNLDTSKQRILPNLSAVKKQNVPLRGLGFKEAKQRIISNKSIISDNFADENSNTLNAINHQKTQQIAHDNNNNFNIQSTNLNYKVDSVVNNFPSIANSGFEKPTYKEMLKGIKKGVTSNSQASLNSLVNCVETNVFISSFLTDTKNRNLNMKQVSLTKLDKFGKPVTIQMLQAKSYVKVLKIKGEKIPAIVKEASANIKEDKLKTNKNLIATKYKDNLTIDDNNQDNHDASQAVVSDDKLFSMSINNLTQSIITDEREKREKLFYSSNSLPGEEA